jgi:hypothetical protein
MSKEIREQINKFKDFLLNEGVDVTFKKKILSSLKDKLGAYGKLPKEIKGLVKFNQIPMDVYQKISDYYEVEKTLPSDTYMEFCNQKLKSIGKGIDDDLFGFLGFIELIGVDKFDRYNTIDLYNGMLDEIRNLPDIKNSDDVIRDYNIFRKTIGEKYSPLRNLTIVITSRFQDEYKYYSHLVNKDF